MEMKAIGMIVLLFIICDGQTQTFDEWFQQKKTQKKYLTQQIAALKVYSEYLKKGYNIARSGLNTIENIKDGNFHLDAGFFDSQKNVNPSISNSMKVANIIGYEAMTIRDFRNLYKWSSDDTNLTADETLYIGHVLADLLRFCDASLVELRSLSQSSDLQMTDDERLERLNILYQDSQDRYSFVKAFDNETRLLAMRRHKEQLEIETSIHLNK
jgi:hypothetical protein